MNKLFHGASALALALAAAGAANAAGLDRSGQSIAPIFAPDNSASLSFGVVVPSVSGEDNGASDGEYNAGETYTSTTLSYTNAINDKLNYSLIYDQPYGANLDYDASPFTSNLGGTGVDLDSQALTFVMRYKLNDRFSVYGGITGERVSADVDLNGTAYRDAISTSAVARQQGIDPATLGAALQGDPNAVAALGGPANVQSLGQGVQQQAQNFALNDGYKFEMEQDTKAGYLIGAAYEIPDIALRFAATYRFEIEHSADTSEDLFGLATVDSTVDYVTPASLNLDFQTGIAADTLLLASYRWTDFSAVNVVPTALGSDLVNLEDGHRFTLGVGRRFNDEFSGSMTFLYEPSNDSDTVSPLGPTDGLFGVTLGAQFTDGPFKVSGGVNYSWLGDAEAGVADRPVASFEDNTSVGFGIKAEMTF